MRKKLLIALVIACSAGAHAQFKDGNQLHKQMKTEFGSVDWFNAIGYVTGVADTLTGVVVCSPGGSGVPASQIYDITKQYLEENPSIRHYSADRLIGRALGRVFPCPKKGQAL